MHLDHSQSLKVEEAKEALRKAVPDFDIYLDRGQIEIYPYTYGYIKEGMFDPEIAIGGWGEKLNRALESDYDGLRATRDTGWLEKESWNDFVNYEKKGRVRELLISSKKAGTIPVFAENEKRFLCLRFSITHPHDRFSLT